MKSSQKYIVTAVKCYEGKGKEQKTTLEENSLSLSFKSILLWKYLYVHKAGKNNELSDTYHLSSTIISISFHFPSPYPPSNYLKYFEADIT